MLSPVRAVAQDLDDVVIRGRVLDQNGAIILGATVTALKTATNNERAAVTNEEGNYRIIELEPGTYTVRVSAIGFAVEEKRELATVAGQNAQLDFTLRPATLVAEQTIVTQADAPLVDTTRTVVGGTITTREVEDLPNVTRSPLDLIFTLGGVTEEALSTRDVAEDRNSGAQGRTPEEAGT
ncbi:MAG: carboxypeptidase-like regulatory domain-containing protein, partial [Pyrinomonadaceae bacterium]